MAVIFKFPVFKFCLLLSFSISIINIYSCKNQVYCPPDYISVTRSLPDPLSSKILAQMGNNELGRFDIKLNTKNRNYFFYSVVVEYPLPEATTELEILHLNTFGGCFIPELQRHTDSSFYAKKEISFNLTFDNRIGKMLGNNHLYFSRFGSDLREIKVPSRISSYKSFDENDNIRLFSDKGPVNIFQAMLSRDEEPEHTITYLQIGFISYDCDQKVDFNAFFTTPEFKRYVAVAEHNQTMDKRLYWSNYIFDDEEAPYNQAEG